MRRRTTIAILTAVILFGGLLRAWDLGGQSYWMDESFTVNAVLAIREAGNQVLDSGFAYRCPLYCFPTAVVTQVFGDSPVLHRALATLAGTALIGVIYLAARRMFTPGIALLAAAFTAISYFQVAWSRQARWYTLFELFFWLAVLCFYSAMYGSGRYRKTAGVLAAAFAALAALTHDLGFLLPALFVAWIGIDVARRKALPVGAFAGIAIAGAGGAVVLALYLGFSPTFVLPFYASFYFRSYWVFLLLASVALLHPGNRFRKETAMLAFLGAAYLVPLSFLSDIINYRYLFHLTPALFMLAAVGAWRVRADLPRRWQKALVIPVVLAALIATGQGVALPRTDYFLEADDPSSWLLAGRPTYLFVPQPDWEAAYAYIREARQSGTQVVTSQPAMNKIYLGEPGYWMRYSYNGKEYMKETPDGREFYVGAQIIGSADELRQLAASSDGYVVLDRYAERRLPEGMADFIRSELVEVFNEKTNAYSEVWVYRF